MHMIGCFFFFFFFFDFRHIVPLRDRQIALNSPHSVWVIVFSEGHIPVSSPSDFYKSATFPRFAQ
jgi:hypothetical protein